MYLTLLASLVWTAAGAAQQTTQRANITGNAVNGKCTIEVNVDGAAEVEVQGNVGRMRNLSGQPAVWRRFVCDGRMPANPADFRFRGIDGRGNVQLLQDPRQTGGRIVFRIDDPQGGREGYTVDLEWRGSSASQWSSGQDTRGWSSPNSRGDDWVREQRYSADRIMPDGPGDLRRDAQSPDRRYYGDNGQNLDRRYYDDNGRWNAAGTAHAVRFCQAAAAQRIQQDGFRNVAFRNVTPDNNPGRNDWVTGLAFARRGWRNTGFQFSCSVNLASGEVRTVEVQRR